MEAGCGRVEAYVDKGLNDRRQDTCGRQEGQTTRRETISRPDTRIKTIFNIIPFAGFILGTKGIKMAFRHRVKVLMRQRVITRNIFS